MNNYSVAIPNTIEFLQIVPLNPLISKCKIKVCYVGDKPNRNQSIITKEVAKQIANSLPGSPIVGYYNEGAGDFEEHNEILKIRNGKIEVGTNTVPYGFVPLNARVWFEKYSDNGVVHEYLVTEGYLWTGQFEEAKKLLQTGGRPQSLEFDENNDTLNAFWTKDYNGNNQFFIINEAVISKLCILGNDIEPCFEGASITSFSFNDETTVQSFSLDADFKRTMFSLIKEMQNILNEGGKTEMEGTEKTILSPEEQPVTDYVEEKQSEEVVTDYVEEKKDEEKKDESTPEVKEEEKPSKETEKEEDKEPEKKEEEKVAKYNLEEVTEYCELKAQYEDLQTKYAAATESIEALTAENASLLSFKASIEKKEKETMIKSFYMLSDEDKKDVVDNIDKYSLSDIESKLSVICVRNKVSFKQEEEKTSNPMTYNLNDSTSAPAVDDNAPAWMKAVAKKQNIIQ